MGGFRWRLWGAEVSKLSNPLKLPQGCQWDLTTESFTWSGMGWLGRDLEDKVIDTYPAEIGRRKMTGFLRACQIQQWGLHLVFVGRTAPVGMFRMGH